LAIEEYDEEVGLDWHWQSINGAMTKAPLGGEETGKNPADRGKSGVKGRCKPRAPESRSA
jgi:putative transposase